MKPLEIEKAFGSFSVDDLDKAKTFYAETLGMDVQEPGGGPHRIAWFKDPAQNWIALMQHG